MGLLKEKTVSNSGEIVVTYWTIALTSFDKINNQVTTIMCGYSSKAARDAGDSPLGEQPSRTFKILELKLSEAIKTELNTTEDCVTPEIFGNVTTNQQRRILYDNWCWSQLNEDGNESNWFADAIPDQ